MESNDDMSFVRDSMDIIKVKAEGVAAESMDGDVLFDETQRLISEFERDIDDMAELKENSLGNMQQTDYNGKAVVHDIQANCIRVNDWTSEPCSDVRNEDIVAMCQEILNRRNYVFIIGYDQCIHMACDIVNEMVVSDGVRVGKV